MRFPFLSPPRLSMAINFATKYLFKASLRHKIFFFGVLLPIAALVLAVAFIPWFVSSHVEELARESSMRELSAAWRVVDRLNAEALADARGMAVAEEFGSFRKPEMTVRLLQASLVSAPWARGVFIAYEPPGADITTNYTLLSRGNTQGLTENARYAPHILRGADFQSSGPPVVAALENPDSLHVYRGLRNRFSGLPEFTGVDSALVSSVVNRPGQSPPPGGGIVGEPVLRSDTQERNTLIIPFGQPIMLDGKFMGVAGIERASTDFDAVLREEGQLFGASYTLISAAGRVIADTQTPENRGRLIEQMPQGEDLRMVMNDTGAAMQIKRQDNDDSLRLAARIPNGNWLLVMQIPYTKYYAPLRRIVHIFIAYTAVASVVIIIGALVFSGTVTQRVTAASDATARVARGDLDFEVVATGSDETGALLREVREMVLTLRRLIGLVQSSTRQVIMASGNIDVACAKQEEVTHSVNTSATEISASVVEIDATVLKLVFTMDSIAKSGHSTKELAREGRTGLLEIIGSMQQLQAASGIISSRLTVISKRAEDITRVVDVMSKVAEQTNLLSLNAAIEAEKAGEYGLGFAVVAAEIRKLADRTATAAQEIRTTIRQMDSSITAGVMEMDKFCLSVRSSTTQTETIAQSLTQILEQVESLLPKFDRVRADMQTHSQQNRQISEAMQQLKSNATLSLESLREFRQASTRLKEASKLLEDELAYFRLKS